MRILIVEDTEYLADALAHVLKRNNHSVDIARDGQVGLDYARTGAYDVIVLDNMLPKLSGVKVSEVLRRESIATPIIMLSAKNDADDKIDGLEAGADDYLGKPFKTGELLARINALARRHNHMSGKLMTIGNLTLNLDRAIISTPAGESNLTAKEFLLLKQLISQANKIVSKSVLFRRAWGQELFNEDKYVEVYISHLRKKLRLIEADSTIQSTRGLGYMLNTKDKTYVS